MIPADSKNIREEYKVLLTELELYNPELLHKKRMLAVTKSDMLDEELMNELRKELPEELDTIFISSVSGYNIMQLKDMLWQKING